MTTERSPTLPLLRATGGFFMDADGSWWMVNQAFGWVEVKPEHSPALKAVLAKIQASAS